MQEQERDHTEKTNWLEIRRETIREMIRPINLIARELEKINEQQTQRLKAKKPKDQRLEYEATTLHQILTNIRYAHHLTIGSYSCPCVYGQ